MLFVRCYGCNSGYKLYAPYRFMGNYWALTRGASGDRLLTNLLYQVIYNSDGTIASATEGCRGTGVSGSSETRDGPKNGCVSGSQLVEKCATLAREKSFTWVAVQAACK